MRKKLISPLTSFLIFQGIVTEEFVTEIDVVKLSNSLIKFSIDYNACILHYLFAFPRYSHWGICGWNWCCQTFKLFYKILHRLLCLASFNTKEYTKNAWEAFKFRASDYGFRSLANNIKFVKLTFLTLRWNWVKICFLKDTI